VPGSNDLAAEISKHGLLADGAMGYGQKKLYAIVAVPYELLSGFLFNAHLKNRKTA
jgi:hypothetical protein